MASKKTSGTKKKAARPVGKSDDAKPKVPSDSTTKASSKRTEAEDPLHVFWSVVASDEQGAQQRRCDSAREALAATMREHPVADDYNILLLYDEGSLIRSDADNIYKAIRQFEQEKDVLLVLHSSGGDIAPAYLISQLCRDHAKQKFIVAIPRRAKSAATLLACGADEIHLGSMSELGPIDPQIGRHPALGLGNALRHIADLVSEYPDASELFAEYLARTVAPIDLGYYERVVESAAQYAERLLNGRAQPPGRSAEDIAHTLVYEYKDHGFVIDRREAASIFGDDTIVTDSAEYNLGNAMYDRLSLLSFICGFHGKNFYWVGSPNSDCSIFTPSE